MSSNCSLDSLNDQALLSQFSDLVRQDREGNANLLRHIDVIDRRKLWARLGHPSLFDFLVARHHVSEATAFKRIGAARTARRFPLLFAMVSRGEIHLSGLHRIKAHLTQENHEQVLAAAKHKTIRQIEELVAHLAPQPDARSTLRALPSRTAAAPMLATPPAPSPVSPDLAASSLPTVSAHAALVAGARVFVAPATLAAPPAVPSPPLQSPAAAVPPAPSPLARRARRDPDPTPLSPGRWKLQVTLGQSSYDKLKQLQDLLAHKVPNGDPAAIVERALDALHKQVHKRKTGITPKPRAPKPELESQAISRDSQTRHVEAAVRREVWPRDDGRCGFVGEDGHRCNETRGLEFAHRKPWAKGGPNTAANLSLRCPAHNALEADRDYGARFMAGKRQPLRVREPIARYRLRHAHAGTPMEVTECGHPYEPIAGMTPAQRQEPVGP